MIFSNRIPQAWTIPCLLALVGNAATATAQDSKPPALVSLVTAEPTKRFLGELTRENGTHIEIVDLKTGQPQIFTKAELKSIRKGVSEGTAIDEVGLPNYMAWRILKVLPAPSAAGKIAQIDGSIVFVSLGKGAGIDVGKELVVHRGETAIRDPDTGAAIGKQRRKIARLEAISVEDNVTKAKLLGDLETRLEIGDLVEPAVVNNLIAISPLVNADGRETVGTQRIAEELTTGLVNRGVRVVERLLLDTVFDELGRQQGSEFDSAKAQQLGKQFGAYGVVVGTVSAKNKFVEAQLRFVRVETGEILVAATQTMRDANLLGGAAANGVPLVSKGPKVGRVIRLLAKDSLDAWQTNVPTDKPNWEMRQGVLINIAHGPWLVTKERFKNFDLYLEFLVPSAAGYGVYLRGRYRINLWDAPRGTAGIWQVGGIHGLIPPAKLAFRGPDTWNSLNVRLIDRNVTVRLNDEIVIDNKIIGRISSGALDDQQDQPGPIALECSDQTKISGAQFRNILIKPLP